jgi:hypothetical protein
MTRAWYKYIDCSFVTAQRQFLNWIHTCLRLLLHDLMFLFSLMAPTGSTWTCRTTVNQNGWPQEITDLVVGEQDGLFELNPYDHFQTGRCSKWPIVCEVEVLCRGQQWGQYDWLFEVGLRARHCHQWQQLDDLWVRLVLCLIDLQAESKVSVINYTVIIICKKPTDMK